MDNAAIIADLALILIVASVTTILFKWMKQPVILGYILAGFLVTKQFQLTPTISDVTDLGTWADIGVVFLMLGLGLEFSFRKLLSVGHSALIAACIIIPGMICAGSIAGLLMGWDVTDSLLLGGMICMSSTAIIMKAFNDMGLRGQKFTQLVLGILVFEDLIAIILLVVISTTAVSKSFQGTELALALVKLGFFLIIWILAGIFFLPTLLHNLKKRGILNDEQLLLLTVGACFAMVIFATKVGFSSELGAFITGSIFAETVESEHIDKLVKPLKDLFGAIFFISVGMMLNIHIVGEYSGQIIFISLVVIIGQILFATCGLILSGQSLKISIQSSFSLTQVGEFAFIIALLGTKLGLLDDYVYPVIVAVAVLTIFISPYLMRLSIPVYNYLDKHLPIRWKLFIDRNSTLTESTGRTENVWQMLLKQILRIVIVYSVVIVAILIVYARYIVPIIDERSMGMRIVVACLTLLILSPFLRAIIAKKNHSREYKYLWASRKINWAPLIMLSLVRFLLAILFVTFVLVKTFNATSGVLFTIGTSVILCMFYSRVLKMQSIKLERRFFQNLNQRSHDEELSKNAVFNKSALSYRLGVHDLHLADFEVGAGSPLGGKTLIELNFRKLYNVHIVSISRANQRINIPGGKEQLFPLDKVLLLGSDEDIAKVTPLFENAESTDAPAIKEVSLEELEVESGNRLINKTIRESGIRDNNKCLVVSIERDKEHLSNPDVQTVIKEGDILWIVGEKDRIHDLTDAESYSVVNAE